VQRANSFTWHAAQFPDSPIWNSREYCASPRTSRDTRRLCRRSERGARAEPSKATDLSEAAGRSARAGRARRAFPEDSAHTSKRRAVVVPLAAARLSEKQGADRGPVLVAELESSHPCVSPGRAAERDPASAGPSRLHRPRNARGNGRLRIRETEPTPLTNSPHRTAGRRLRPTASLTAPAEPSALRNSRPMIKRLFMSEPNGGLKTCTAAHSR